MASARYLESLPPETSAQAGLTRLLGDSGDAEWFIRHVNNPRTTKELAGILQQGAEQILLLEQKTYLPGPAWQQWLAGEPQHGLSPALQGTLQGMKEFEQVTMTYRVSLAFLQASASYRKAGREGIQGIPDPFRPGTFLLVTSTTNGVTLSSALLSKDGRNYSHTFQAPPEP